MALTFAQHVYGVARLITMIVWLFAAIFMLHTYSRKKRPPALYMGLTMFLLSFMFIHSVVEYISFLMGTYVDARNLVIAAILISNGVALTWTRLLVTVERKWNIAFYAAIVVYIILVNNVLFFPGQVKISVNQLNYLSYSYSFPTAALPVIIGIISLFEAMVLIKMGLKDRTSESGYILFMLGLTGILFVILQIVWILELISDVEGTMLATLVAFMLIISERPPDILLKIWIKK